MESRQKFPWARLNFGCVFEKTYRQSYILHYKKYTGISSGTARITLEVRLQNVATKLHLAVKKIPCISSGRQELFGMGDLKSPRQKDILQIKKYRLITWFVRRRKLYEYIKS